MENDILTLLEEADDIADVAQLMKDLGIATKGCKDIQQMIERTCNHLRERQNQSFRPNEAFKVISEAQKMEKEKIVDLFSFYRETDQELSQLDETIQEVLKKGKTGDDLKRRMHEMENRSYVVLVAGETSAGKSSMLNLILGEELLPFSVLSTTSAICELKYGERRRLVVHYKEESKKNGLKIREFYLNDSSPYLEQISEFVHVKSDGSREQKASEFEKVELFWPHELLKNGVTIVDSPGVGESAVMDQIVVSYLPNAFAFIYVINSSNAGGVQRDRIVKLLEQTKHLSEEQLREFSPMSALFVCNKWDTIPPKEADEVMEHIICKIQQCWPGLDPDFQVIHLSTENALRAQKFGILSDEFVTLTERTGILVRKSIEARLQDRWRWLDFLLSRMVFNMDAFIQNVSSDREQAKKRLDSVMSRLETLQKEQILAVQELKGKLKDELNNAVNHLIDHLKNKDVVDMFGEWKVEEVPAGEGSWEDISGKIHILFQERLQNVIEEWEKKEEYFSTALKSTVDRFLKKYSYLEEELQGLENEFVTTEIVAVERYSANIISSEEEFLTRTEKVLLAAAAPMFLPYAIIGLGFAIPVALVALPALGVKAVIEHFKEETKKSKYLKDPCELLRKEAARYLEKVATSESLQPLVEKQLKETRLSLKQLEAQIPRLIEGDVKLCQRLFEETRSKTEVEALYVPRKEKCKRLRGELGMFCLSQIRSLEISWQNLRWDSDEEINLQSPLQPGAYSGWLKKDRRPDLPVTLWVRQELLNADNVTMFFTKEQALRELKHPHIVEFYGTVFRKQHRGTEAVFVMERCGENLKSLLADHSENSSAMHDLSGQRVLKWLQQITDALHVIHNKGYVHGDLRLENVLFERSSGSVKLSSVLLRKQITVERGSKCDAFLHLSPDAIRNRLYDSKSDIYSLGSLMWEIWAGSEAYTELAGSTIDEFLEKLENGYRPSISAWFSQPPPRLVHLMQECWKTEPNERKTITECQNEIQKILDEKGHGDLS